MDQVDMSKIDAEKKVERILKFVRRRSRARKEPDIVGIVEDFHKQYQLLYAQYDNLKRDPCKKSPVQKGNEKCSCGGSDSEYYSSEDVEANTALGNHRASFRKMATDLEFELKKTYAEVADLKHQLSCMTKEKEALDSNHRDALRKMQEIETLNAELQNEIDANEKRLCALGTMHKGRVAELEEKLAGLKIELETEKNAKRESSNENHEFEIVLDRQSKEISRYVIQVKTLKEELARKTAAERILTEEKEGLQVQVMDLESEIDLVRRQMTESESELKTNIHEINDLREEKGKLNAKIRELETSIRDRGLELPVFDQKTSKKERDDRTSRSMPPKTKMVRRLSLNNLDHYHLVKKMEDLAQEFDKKAEDSIRLLSCRIEIAGKMHHENTEVYKLAKERLEQENESLKQKAITYEAELKKLKDTMESKRNGFNSLAYKLEEDNEKALLREKVMNFEEKLKVSKAMIEFEMKMREMHKENEEKVMNLKAKSCEEDEEKFKALNAMSELEKKVRELEKINKEKDEMLLDREEEKREAIRQLCVLIDYQRSCSDHLKQSISSLTRLRIKNKT